MLELREHQMQVIDALREGFRQGHRSQLLYAPTGFGKTEVAIYLMKATTEKYNKAAIVLDRLVLVDQTSMRLTKYGLDHGVYQSGHWKYAPYERLQVCSAQTLEARGDFPKIDLLIVDEAHITRKQTSEFIKNNPGVRIVGLTATPFTKGLGELYSNVVCGATNGWLVDNRWLTPLRVYIAKEIDMTGAKKIAGEWSADVVAERGMKITGDIVEEWSKKTHEIFGKPEKTIVFCSGVAHGADLVEQFARKGYNFVSISYKDNDEFKKAAIEDFAKPDTEIHGLIATDILTRGFDVPDVKIGVSARPFSKSLSSHIQQMGRVMRPYEGKDFALWLCLAKGSKVLTDKGLVPIDKVSLDHKIWDGTNFVSHGGAVCNGIQKVITYQGLTATPGHLVHTAEGWRTFGYCASKQIKITQTGLGGTPIRISENYRPASLVAGKVKQAIHSCAVRMRKLRLSVSDFLEQFTKRQNKRMQGLQSAYAGVSNVALQQGSGNACKVYESIEFAVSSIRWAWNQVRIQRRQGWDSMDYEQSRNSKIFQQSRTISYSNRQNKPGWKLRTWKFKVDFRQSQPIQQTWQSSSSKNAQIQNGPPGNSLFRFHIKKIILDWHDRFTNYRKIQSPVIETEREVWDILNAGPNNRFTCEGLLVHNCHSGNFLRFRDDWDEIYDMGVKKLDERVEKAKREPPEKVKKESKCPVCSALWPKGSDICTACGHVRKKRNQVEAVAGELQELHGGQRVAKDEKQVFYSELIYYAKERNYNPHWASHKYREKFGVWPRGLEEQPKPTSLKTLNWIKHKNIAWAKKQQRLRVV